MADVLSNDEGEALRERRAERVTADVFISYKRTDRPKIAALARALDQMGDVTWFDLSLRTGDRFNDVIEANARACRAMIVCWTRACFTEEDSGYVRWEAGIGRERSVLAPIALEPPAQIGFQDDWDSFQIEDLSHWLTAPPPASEAGALDRVGEHGALSDPAFMRLLDKLGEPAMLNRPGLAELSGVYAAFAAAGEPHYTGQRPALEAAVRLGRNWLLDHGADPAAEKLARVLVDYEYAALGAQVTQEYGRLLGNRWTPPGAEAMQRERGLARNVDRLERALGGKDAHIEQLQTIIAKLRDAERSQEAKAGIFGRRGRAPEAELREAIEAAGADIRRPGSVWRDALPGLAPEALPEMVSIPPGRFLMGSPKNEERWKDYDGREEPQHEVRIDHVFALGKYAVTFAEWEAARAAGAKLENPSDSGWGRDRRPVVNVSWKDAQAYLEWLNAELGLSGRPDAYRLPSEAEWEYACRAGMTTPFSFGATISTAQANYNGNRTYGAGTKGEYRQKTTPVGSFPANAFGLFDMHGNVWEWCEDVWHANYNGAPDDGSAWTAGGVSSLRVLRGGSWDDDPFGLRSASRVRNGPTFRVIILGFRLARTVSTR